jgi:uncharacterized protein YbjT (DUF2867 family)
LITPGDITVVASIVDQDQPRIATGATESLVSRLMSISAGPRVASFVMSRIVIIGGHGKVALHLARILTERGDEVTSVFRNPDHAEDVVATAARPVVADIEVLDTDALADLLAGHAAVVFSAGAGGGNPARTYAVDRDAAIRVIDAARQAGVRRFVMVSYFGAGPDHGVPQDNSFFHYAESKAAADAHLRASDLDWTVLGPGHLTLEPATGRIAVGAAARGRDVSREDVALVAAAALNDDSTIHRTIEFNNGDVPIAEALAASGDRKRGEAGRSGSRPSIG